MSGIKIKHQPLSLVIIGCGNVAWHLAKRIAKNENHQLKIYNHKDNGELQMFKDKFACEVFGNFKNIDKTADYYFICVSDQAIPAVVKLIKVSSLKGVVMHCAGSQPLSLLGSKAKNTAVFYPLQTFTKADKIHWSDVPIILEANHPSILPRLQNMAAMFSNNINILSYQERLQLHLAAVFANNFTNALFVEAYRLLPKVNDAHHDLLLPLIQQTVLKLERVHPLNAQTGPAKRHDNAAMEQHLKLLKDNQTLKKIYKDLSDLIMQQQKHIHD